MVFSVICGEVMRYNKLQSKSGTFVFVPHWTKQQFVAWADKRYPGHKHSKMKKKQLIAIFINS